jgi:hypothetical protein
LFWRFPVRAADEVTMVCFVPVLTRLAPGAICLVALVAASLGGPANVSAAEPPEPSLEEIKFFEEKVRPILAENCYKCHGSEDQKGSLRLDVRSMVMAGGESGPAIVPGKPDESLLVEAVKWESYEMPPSGKLSDLQIATISDWIKRGAPMPQDRRAARCVRAAGRSLLASPRYGERWARHWLDLVRYAESDGFRQDAFRPHAWRYRDYVIRAFNDDKPYDRFILEQLAGDEMRRTIPRRWPPRRTCGTGSTNTTSATRGTSGTVILIDVTNVTGEVFLGLGMGCARCHDHKFDPILKEGLLSTAGIPGPDPVARASACRHGRRVRRVSGAAGRVGSGDRGDTRENRQDRRSNSGRCFADQLD